jgi:hypothetical protein
MKLNKLILLLLVANGLLAQHTTTAKIETVKENGLHKMLMPAEIRSYSKEELGDFRILDSKGMEVPYFILQGNNENTASSFSEYKIVSKTVLPNKKTTIIFENPKNSLSEITLSITNSDVTKSYSISGSNDQKEWFGLVNNSQLYNLQNSEDTSVFKTINLPLTSYRYLKIELNDKKTLPINVLKIGFFVSKTQLNALEEIQPKKTKIQQFPAEKKTRIYISFDRPQVVSQISFKISNPNLFQRNARIYIKKKTRIKHKNVDYNELFSSIELNSNHQNSFSIPQLFEKNFYLEIDNKDSQPLTLAAIQFFQNPISVIADLRANEKYTIATENPKLYAPEYDLENFKNSIGNNLPETKMYDIQQRNAKETLKSNNSFWQQPWFMWLCIGLGGLAIAYFTMSLVKDMKNNSTI